MKPRLISMPLLRSLINLLAQVYKQVAPNGAFHPPLCWSAFQRAKLSTGSVSASRSLAAKERALPS
jgi:hypothetical protein